MLNIFVEKYNDLSDNELITKIRNNDQEAFETLFARYLPKINALISKTYLGSFEREDILQDATISFYYATQMFDFSSSSFSTFLSICVERSLKSTIKKASALKRIPDNMLVSFEEHAEGNLNTISAEEAFFVKDSSLNAASKITDKLSKLELSVLNSFLKTGSYDATAKELLVSRKTVDNALVRIRRKINS